MKTGSRLVSIACEAEVVVVRGSDVELSCGGHPMLSNVDERATAEIDPRLSGGTLLGKRYTHASSGLQVLCVKSGDGTLSVDGEPLELLESKQLPSSD